MISDGFEVVVFGLVTFAGLFLDDEVTAVTSVTVA
jgi:hypothetical protein